MSQKYLFIDRDGTRLANRRVIFRWTVLTNSPLNGRDPGATEAAKSGLQAGDDHNQDGLGTQSFPQADFDGPHT